MEQKTINQNKLQTLLCIIALTLGVLVSATLFSMPPVHAATSSTYTLKNSIYDLNNNLSTSYRVEFTTDLIVCGYLEKDYGDYKMYSYLFYDTEKQIFYTHISDLWSVTDSYFNRHIQFTRTDIASDGSLSVYSNDNGKTWFGCNGYVGVRSAVNQKYTSSGTCFYFDSLTNAKTYCQTGEINGRVDDLTEIPDLSDESYTYIGFSINGKNARWTGTTERSYLKDQEVEEYTRITYGFASSEDQTLNADNFIEYDQDFAVGEKQMTIPWSEIESNKKDGEFIRQVNFIPCYRVPGAFYLGKGVKVFFNSDGTVDKIEQATIPTDSETIGNDISLIGFRYNNSFHAEWVDVWSNAVNKSAFDLNSGGQYLSLGIKAVYYDGSKADIDFYSLDRKNLTWNKTFSDFKENNGSPIKSLYFTPYTKTGVNNPWNKGNSTVVNFDEKGNASSSFDTGDDGTVHLSDFKLTGVVWNKPVVKNGTITWTGTTPNNDLLFIPDSDTLVIATYPRYDSDMNTSYETWSTTTIGKGSMNVNVDYLIDYYKNSELAWNGEMWLTPCYKKGGVLYMGEPVIINCLKGTVSDIVVDKDSGKAEQVDKTDQNKSDADSILNVGNQFYSIINGLIGSLQQLPALLTAIFGFLPSSIINLLYASFAVIIICRILGR